MTISRARWFDSVWYDYLEGRIRQRLPWQKPFRGTLLNRSHPLARGLIGCWLMNEHIGTIVYDHGRYGLHGTVVGATWTNDGLLFANNYVTAGRIDTHKYFDSLTELSIAFSATALESGSLSGALISAGQYNDVFFIGRQGVSGDDKMQVYTLGNKWDISVKQLWAIGKRNTAGISFKGSTYGRIYINGLRDVEDTSVSAATGVADANAELTIGKDISFGLDWGGYIHHMYIWDRALSDAEHSQLHYQPYGMFL